MDTTTQLSYNVIASIGIRPPFFKGASIHYFNFYTQRSYRILLPVVSAAHWASMRVLYGPYHRPFLLPSGLSWQPLHP